MSTEIDRFVSDLKTNPDLLAGVRDAAGSLGTVTAFAQSKGYNISLADAKSWLESKAGKPLSDEQLDAVAGGKGGSVAANTNVAANAEVVANAVVYANAAAATNVAGAAEVAAAAVIVIVAT